MALAHDLQRSAGMEANNGMNSAARRGFSLAELLVALAVIAIMVLTALPFLLTYLPSATVTWAARDIQSALNRSKMLAVTTRQSICFQTVSGGYQFLIGSCAGTAWTGEGTDSAGTFKSPINVTITNGGTSPIFTQFGTASQTGTITVTAPGGQSRTATVWTTGRITIP